MENRAAEGRLKIKLVGSFARAGARCTCSGRWIDQLAKLLACGGSVESSPFLVYPNGKVGYAKSNRSSHGDCKKHVSKLI
jgi:hypothetical protein